MTSNLIIFFKTQIKKEGITSYAYIQSNILEKKIIV